MFKLSKQNDVKHENPRRGPTHSQESFTGGKPGTKHQPFCPMQTRSKRPRECVETTVVKNFQEDAPRKPLVTRLFGIRQSRRVPLARSLLVLLTRSYCATPPRFRARSLIATVRGYRLARTRCNRHARFIPGRQTAARTRYYSSPVRLSEHTPAKFKLSRRNR